MLKDIRKARGMTQEQLADLSGVSLAMIRKYEQGIRDINKASYETLVNLSTALSCDIGELMK